MERRWNIIERVEEIDVTRHMVICSTVANPLPLFPITFPYSHADFSYQHLGMSLFLLIHALSISAVPTSTDTSSTSTSAP